MCVTVRRIPIIYHCVCAVLRVIIIIVIIAGEVGGGETGPAIDAGSCLRYPSNTAAV